MFIMGRKGCALDDVSAESFCFSISIEFLDLMKTACYTWMTFHIFCSTSDGEVFQKSPRDTGEDGTKTSR